MSVRHSVRSFVIVQILLTAALALSAQTALQFVPVTPCRVADTRLAPGPFGGPIMEAGSTRDIPIPLSACNIPATAAAYSLNVAVVPAGSLDYLTIWPKDQPKPYVATLNSYDGRTKANAAIVPGGTDAAVSVYVTNRTHVILDINGYFKPADNTTLAFFPLTPCRVADTRWSQGPLGGPMLAKGAERAFPMLASACNIPNSALGYSLNIAVIPQTTLNYLTLWPTGQSRPYVATLNAPKPTVVANAAIVPAGVSGAVSVYVTDAAHLIMDIDGYFAPPNSAPTPLSLYSLVPCRVLDTRSPGGGGSFVGTIPVDVLASPCNVPGAQAYVFNATVVPTHGPMGYLSLWPDAEGQPYVATLNAYDGAVTSNMAIVPTLNGDVDAFAYNPTQLIMDIFSYFAPILPLRVTTASLPAGTVGYGYNTTLAAAGGVLPYHWTMDGTVPQGLNFDSPSGSFSGIPTMTGNYPFTVHVIDSETPAVTASADLEIDVTATLSQLTITTATLPDGTQNSPYSAALAASGGITPYTWRIVSGSLPSGLHLNIGTGAITGTPSGGGLSNFTVQVTDSNTPASTATKSLSITIDPAVSLSITTASMPNGTAGQPYSAQLTAIGGVYPYNWSVIAGKLPDGLNLNPSTGLVSGIPVLVGDKDMTVQVTDSETPQVSASKEFTFTINPPSGGNCDGNLALLSGHYAFYMNGFNSTGPITFAGSFISDGHGNISSGSVDGNSVAGQPFTTSVTGTYCINSNGLHTMTMHGSSWGPVTFAFVLTSDINGQLIEYDDTTGHGSRGAGEIRQADSTAFSLSLLNSNWMFGVTGAALHSDSSVKRFVDVGRFALANGSMTAGSCYINDGGAFQTCTFTGTVSNIDPQTGRGTVNVQSSNGANHQVVYVVNRYNMIMASTDSVPSTHVPMGAGDVVAQDGSFNNASLNGTVLLVGQDIHGADGLDQSAAILDNFDGAGHFTGIAEDEDTGGTITQGQPDNGTYTVQSNGALTFNCQSGCPVGFLFKSNKGMFVGTGTNTLFGQFGPQTGGPFSNASISGNYVGGTLPPLDYVNGHTGVTVGSADGAGTFTVSGYGSQAEGLEQFWNEQDVYSIASNGRGTSPDGTVIYVGSPNFLVVMSAHPDAEMDFFQK